MARLMAMDTLSGWLDAVKFQTAPTRFASWRAWPARMLLAGLAALILFGLVSSLQPGAGTVSTSNDPTQTDAELYRAIVGRMQAGEGYYDAVTAEQRLRGYPLRPVFTVRLPTLASFEAVTGVKDALAVLAALALATWLVLVRRLRREIADRPTWVAAGALAACGLVPCFFPNVGAWHEAWASALVVLSLALRTRERWLASVLVGLLAVCLRELALPYLCVMAATAFAEGARREAVAWALAVALFAAFVGLHALIVSGYLLPSDTASPGWMRAGGWPFVLSMLSACTVLVLLPLPTVAVLAPLALLGWAAWRNPIGLRAALLLSGYAGVFMLVGRVDNFYWGLMLGPLLLIGLAFAAPALRDLAHAALSARQPEGRPARA